MRREPHKLIYEVNRNLDVSGIIFLGTKLYFFLCGLFGNDYGDDLRNNKIMSPNFDSALVLYSIVWKFYVFQSTNCVLIELKGDGMGQHQLQQ